MVIVVQDVGIGFIIASEVYAFIKTHSRDDNRDLTAGLPLTQITRYQGKANTIQLDQHEVRSTLRRLSARKAAGPDGVIGRTLKACEDQLVGVFNTIFSLLLLQSASPTCNHHPGPEEAYSELS